METCLKEGGVQSVRLLSRQTADVIDCQSVENRKEFFLPFPWQAAWQVTEEATVEVICI